MKSHSRWFIALLHAWHKQFGADWTYLSEVLHLAELEAGCGDIASVLGEELDEEQRGGLLALYEDSTDKDQRLARAVAEVPRRGEEVSIKEIERSIARLVDVDAGGYKLRRTYDRRRDVHRYAVEATRRKPVLPSYVTDPPPLPKGVALLAQFDQRRVKTQITQDAELERLTRAAADKREDSRGPTIAEQVREAADTAAQAAQWAASDPAPHEVWTGPCASEEETEVAAARIRKSGLGCGASVLQIDGLFYAKSEGVQEATRVADAVRRIHKCALTRIGLRGVAPSPEELRQRAAGAANADRAERHQGIALRGKSQPGSVAIKVNHE